MISARHMIRRSSSLVIYHNFHGFRVFVESCVSVSTKERRVFSTVGALSASFSRLGLRLFLPCNRVLSPRCHLHLFLLPLNKTSPRVRAVHRVSNRSAANTHRLPLKNYRKSQIDRVKSYFAPLLCAPSTK